MKVSSIILTLGTRPDELAAAAASTSRQHEVDHDTIVVWNGVEPADVDGTEPVLVATNAGIPGGRNIGARAATGDLLLFLDDDAVLRDDDALGRLARMFESDPTLAVVGLRIVDEYGETAQRHVPRLGGRGATVAGEVTAFLGGAACVRASAFDEVGGYADEFFYSMEETDLAWRLVDRGWSIRYEPELVVEHPRTSPSRHADAVRRTARNRVWLARRRLPLTIAGIYLLVWLVITGSRDVRAIPSVVAGSRDGIREPCGPRAPMSWSTVIRLTRLGRPPIV